MEHADHGVCAFVPLMPAGVATVRGAPPTSNRPFSLSSFYHTHSFVLSVCVCLPSTCACRCGHNRRRPAHLQPPVLARDRQPPHRGRGHVSLATPATLHTHVTAAAALRLPAHQRARPRPAGRSARTAAAAAAAATKERVTARLRGANWGVCTGPVRASTCSNRWCQRSGRPWPYRRPGRRPL